jgi:hypothetical protein
MVENSTEEEEEGPGVASVSLKPWKVSPPHVSWVKPTWQSKLSVAVVGAYFPKVTKRFGVTEFGSFVAALFVRES